MMGKPDISHSFYKETGDNLGFRAAGVCSQTLEKRLLGPMVSVKGWMIEAYSEYAGEIFFRDTGLTSGREKDSIHLYAPGCAFREDTRRANLPLRETFIRFSGGEVPGLDRMAGSGKYCRFFDRKNRVIRLMHEAAETCFYKGESAFWHVQSLLSRCADYFLNCSVKISDGVYEIADADVSPEAEFLEKAESYMRSSVSRGLRNSDIAAYMNVSESTFNHKFKKIAGVPPYTRMLEIKINAAKNLLFKGAGLKNIAEATGFRDQYYLSRIFKKITGLPPRDFKLLR